MQRNSEITLWGWGKALEPLKIMVSWDTSFHYETKLNKLGQWNIKIKTPDNAGPHSITFQGFNTIEVNDILCGEVWLCSGQSNMEWSANMKINNGKEEKVMANYPDIRLFIVPHHTAAFPQDDCKGQWVKCSPETMANFSAIGYFFGRELYKKINQPIGLIQSAWGGTPAEVWLPEDAIKQDFTLSMAAKRLRDEAWAAQQLAVNFNGMIQPLIPYKIAGALWYQGETNTSNANTYSQLLSTLIKSWRAKWGFDFPFYFVQIAPFKGYGSDNNFGAEVRHQQAKVVDMVDNTEMIVVSDIGDLEDIHPGNKMDVGKRLARVALKNNYHLILDNVVCPRYKSHVILNNEVHITFLGAPNGLVSKGDLIKDFEIKNQYGHWVQPKGVELMGNKAFLTVKEGDQPIDIRFAFSNTANPGLFNNEGLPASCFTTEK